MALLIKPSPSSSTQTCCGWSWSTAAAQSPLVLVPASFPSSLSRRPLPSLLVQLGRPRRGRGRRIAIGCVASRRSSEAPSSSKGSSSAAASSGSAAMAAAAARVKAVATIKATVGGFLDSLRPSRAIDDVKDLIGRSLYLELVSSQLDASEHY